MTNNKVASYAERIERLLDERATIDADIKDIYTEVKSADLKPKALRKAIANKRRKVDAQFEADVEEYAALLLALPGATYPRGVAEKTGIPKSTLQRRVPRERNGTDHDSETGEIVQPAGVKPNNDAPLGHDSAREPAPPPPPLQTTTSHSRPALIAVTSGQRHDPRRPPVLGALREGVVHFVSRIPAVRISTPDDGQKEREDDEPHGRSRAS